MSRTFTPCQTAERSIQKKYRRELWGPFVAACKRYELIQSGDRRMHFRRQGLHAPGQADADAPAHQRRAF